MARTHTHTHTHTHLYTKKRTLFFGGKFLDPAVSLVDRLGLWTARKRKRERERERERSPIQIYKSLAKRAMQIDGRNSSGCCCCCCCSFFSLFFVYLFFVNRPMPVQFAFSMVVGVKSKIKREMPENHHRPTAAISIGALLARL